MNLLQVCLNGSILCVHVKSLKDTDSCVAHVILRRGRTTIYSACATPLKKNS